jgi:hypothetical protein
MALVILTVPVLGIAATTNPAPGSTGVMVLPFTFDRAITATATPISFTLPFKATLLAASAYVRDIDVADANETYTVDIKEGGTTVLSSAMAFTADGQTKEATISDSALADEATITIVITLGGTTPSLTDLTVLLIVQQL